MAGEWGPQSALALAGRFSRKAALLSWGAALLPLTLLALLLGGVAWLGPLGVLTRAVPPVEALSIERVDIRSGPSRLVVSVINGGPDEVTVAQVLVDNAYWAHTVEPDRTLPRWGRATVTIPYPWVAGEPHKIKLLTSTGLTFAADVPVAVETPSVRNEWFVALTMIGVYVGVIPVALGLLWYPFLSRLDRQWLHFFLALTAGLLVFLAADALAEAVKIAGKLAPAFHGGGLVVVALVGTLAALRLAGGFGSRLQRDDESGRRALAGFVALGIGLHNLGEGMAVGAAFSVGEAALGASLVIGFAIHNVTEGLGIAAPVAHDRVGFLFLAGVGLLAGGPTIFGSWIGGLAYGPVLAAVFFSVGAAAALQVVSAILGLVRRRGERELYRPTNIVGFALGLAVMYATALLVVI